MKRDSLWKILLILILVVASCATNRQKVVTRNDCMLFPYGIYKQNVSVKFDKGTIKFKGVLRKDKISNTIYGLSAFDTTIFKIKDDKSGQVEIDIYNEKLAGKEEKIKEIYRTLSNVLDTEQCINTEKSFVINKEGENSDIKVEFKKFDINKIPSTTTLFNKDYEVIINTVDYEI
ncbi:MAG: hypothetical protein NTY22_03680 [Proteobacteria bacterium]|nr:hypothetical protein [Pseudomonadota bacterium]